MVEEKPWQYVVISHSHWDREWYVPFQTYRIRLVGLMDSVLDILSSDSRYEHFMTDGQSVLLEDYLAIRPDRRPLVARLVRDGRQPHLRRDTRCRPRYSSHLLGQRHPGRQEGDHGRLRR